MQAVTVVQGVNTEGPTLQYDTVRDPIPGPTELLVAVKAAGINRIDLARAHAHAVFRADEPQVAGLEFAGEVVAIGDKVDGFSVGDRVMAMSKAAYAELATVDYRIAMKMPASFSYDEAVAVVTVFGSILIRG